jgi:predicted ArsR family transcriptional regulator
MSDLRRTKPAVVKLIKASNTALTTDDLAKAINLPLEEMRSDLYRLVDMGVLAMRCPDNGPTEWSLYVKNEFWCYG